METTSFNRTLNKQLSISLFQPQPNTFIPKKRQSMHRRLSTQNSVQDLLKNLKTDQLLQSTSNSDTSKTQGLNKSLSLQNLANLSSNVLKTKYENNPFLKFQLKHLAKGLKQNIPVIKKSSQILDKYSFEQKISYRQHRQMKHATQTQMFKKVINTVNQGRQFA